VGGSTEPCGTPACIYFGADFLPSTETLNFLGERRDPVSLIRLIENYNSDNLYSKPRCHVVSKGFSKVKVKATLRLTISQSVSLGVEPNLGLMTRYLLLFDG
jgi:hypothetical protein